MSTTRLEAFSDGVVAILITIMVLELRPPHEASFDALRAILPTFLSYLLSFVFLAIYWNNHHHMLHLTTHVTGGILWANIHLLFWLSLVPFVTAWIGESHTAAVPTALYGVVLVLAAIAYTILQRTIIASQGAGSRLAAAIGGDRKGKFSIALYLAAIPLSFVRPAISDLLYATVALIWLVPDRRIEEHLLRTQSSAAGRTHA
ncbi:MAG TPA: TMEM175 family protein [Gemmatimonadaceae bacterium]|jgi:TMEM175 potassium channel family protein|nr:TMEM175 family protein [Gemmatimonadaceae bacterium]